MDIPALEAAVRSLEHSIGVFTWCLLGSTFVVSLGLILEYWHPVSEFIDELKWPMSVVRWPKFMEIAGGILVTIGVLGEFGFTLEVFVLEGRLEQANHVIRDTLTAKLGEADKMAKTAVSDASSALSQGKDALSKAGAAEAALGRAEAEARNAQTASSSALTMAGQARKEADSFEADIRSAKEQAAEAESHLAEATKSANILTAKLERLTTPRRLPRSVLVVAPLQAFKGTEYVFIGTCGDQECFDLLSDIDELLKLAGWKRIKGPPMRIGVPQILINNDKEFTVDLSVSTGTVISAETPNGIESVKGLPDDQLADYIRAAIALNKAVAQNVSPSEITGRPVNIKPGTSKAVEIDVGRKPL
jgi:hypothetical protein